MSRVALCRSEHAVHVSGVGDPDGGEGDGEEGVAQVVVNGEIAACWSLDELDEPDGPALSSHVADGDEEVEEGDEDDAAEGGRRSAES